MRRSFFTILILWPFVAIAQTHESGFPGVWETSFGRMRLLPPSQGVVKGVYAFDGRSNIEGKVSGSKFEFKYKEKNAQGEGWFELKENGQRFEGRWRVQGKSEWKEWTGQRLKAIPNRVWLLVAEAHWEGKIEEKEYAFGDMLKAFFDRTSNVEVRRRSFTDATSLRRWLEEVAYLPEPTAVVIASHGETTGVKVDGVIVPAGDIVESLAFASSLKALHFSACLVMKERFGKDVFSGLKNKNVKTAVSGYANSVDWAVSALFEMTYLDMLLTRGLSPANASKAALRMFPLAGPAKLANVSIDPAGFKFLN